MALLENCVGYGPLANRPEAGASGALYFCSDTKQAFRDNGITWDDLALGGLPLIAAQRLEEDAAELTFADIPVGYNALQLDAELRGAVGASTLNLMLRLNGDDEANYDTQVLDAWGSTPEASEYFAATEVLIGQMPGATAPAGVRGGTRVYLPDYANTGFEKRMHAHSGGKFVLGPDGLGIWSAVGYWRNTATITQISLSIQYGDFAAGSYARLYGLN